jgi:ABC-type multidrug transport system ATPase subunit
LTAEIDQFFQEPTTGLSPDTRRQLWSVVNDQKKSGRAILISTHSMEEAETLCSRIGILVNGRLSVIGSPMQLKDRHGDGFKLSFATNYKLDAASANKLLQGVRSKLCADATIGTYIGKSINFLLPKSSMDTGKVLRIFEALESKKNAFKKAYGIEEWGIAQATLEEVFINTVESQSK